MWCVYILRCADGTFYTGSTNDLERRMGQHRLGKGAKYVRGRLPVELVYHVVFNSRSAAQRKEAEVKKLSRDAKERLCNSWWTLRGMPTPCSG